MFKEPSTYAGLGLLFSGLAHVIATKGADATAWTSVIGGIAAMFLREQATAA